MPRHRSQRAIPVLLAAGVVALLAGTLILRATPRRSGPAAKPPAASVPAPAPIDLARLEFPRWSSREAREFPVRSRVDLDLVAPLGDGPGNAALFFREFSKSSGSRVDELESARARMVDDPEGSGRIFRADDPLLLEAEPWVDQATMRFYPDLLALEGWNTEVPDLLFALDLARSWVARGRGNEDPSAALADARRAVRLGRLLRQEDTTIIADLVGLACERFGLTAIYDQARTQGDLPLALAAAVALGEIAPQRLLTSERITRVEVSPFLSADRTRVELPAKKLDELVEMATSDPDRRFRGEATLDLGIVSHLGVGAARERARKVLDELARGDDERIASLAAWAIANPPDAAVLEPAPED